MIKKMSRKPEYLFFQRRNTDDPQALEKLFNIANYQRNTNQNHNAISPQTCHIVNTKRP